ncbi:NAD(P)-dependent oxidoreductase [Actinacidiphila rubida]|uniref:3-hydroxyisobutyrate dehydrogenase n=1 Tax=Actinacidiphila rubida TaxID=310780 RepID=A0A1H8PZJ8_9ACTN|nr:NAD(P)-dependent oxidoreductase [Actinacidiphila rubida]SEO47422.1 3-hydroxyisobutyrate dehydrogenase [Actinacidiphila rubida]
MSTRDNGPAGQGRPVVAVLGIGTMGDAMARNIAAAGLGLRVWNRRREPAEALAEVGAVVCDTAAEACRGAKVVLTVLANERIVAEVVEQAREGIDRDAVLLQCCTVSPEGSRRLAAQAAALGVAYVEAPLLGSKEPAVAGTLTILAAASDMCAGERVQPVLDAVGTRTVWLDGISQPSSLKLAYNAWVLTTVEGIAEALSLADGLGVDPRQLINVINGSALDSTYVQSKGPKMISDDLDTPSFPLEAAAKDAGLIADAARGAGLRLGIVEVVRDRLQLAASSGLGRADVAATYRTSRQAVVSTN